MHVTAFLRTEEGYPFISPNRLAARCRYVINFDDLVVNERVENNWWFVQADFLEHFFKRHEPDAPYVLFSSNSDRPIDRSLRRFFDRRGLRTWFAANLVARHPKLRAFPLGIADAKWAHGDAAALAWVQAQRLEKTILFDASYDVATYPLAREYCLERTGVPLQPRRPFRRFLEELASSYFCIAPRGKGIDTHRVWEALYLRTIPIVTRSVLTDEHPDLPMIVLNDWSEFRPIDFTQDLYGKTWGDWDPAELNLDRYLSRVEQVRS